ncbi:MAG: CRISPR-associated helicase Cas3' [Agrobacterium albertimagni]
MTVPKFHSIWAKTNEAADDQGGSCRYHPLPFHSLDVAAVAEQCIRRDAKRLESIARGLGVDADRLRAVTLWLVALHDIGKASSGFQLKVPELWNVDCLGQKPTLATHGAFHASMTAWYLAHDNDATIAGAPAAMLFSRMLPWKQTARDAVIDAVAGHHGRPVAQWGLDGQSPWPHRKVGKGLVEAARELASDLVSLFGAEPLPPNTDKGAAIAYAWWLATLLPFADWIGSNTEFFKPRDTWLSLVDYWGLARKTSENALAKLGLLPPAVTQPSPRNVLAEDKELSPTQIWASTVALPQEGPVLAIVEDMTGSGKTEAALMLAHRMMAEGISRGFHMSLPTMATADAMHRRLRPIYQKFFEQPGKFDPGGGPSLALAHGRAALAHGAAEDEASVAAYCSDWIASENRRAFFAAAGAGTVDQAILAVLPSKYQTLRLRGLADKVLIIDEAHAYDTYMSVEIAALLRFHAAQGGSAILLSATLPARKRLELATAFTEGAGWATPSLGSDAYPLTTFLSRAGVTEAPGLTRSGTERKVEARRVESVEAAETMAMEAAKNGAAVAVIRSTVDTAIETYERLSAGAPPGVQVQLFHARFIHEDRQRIERDVVARFGKDGGPEERRRRILVATAVIEQSLDLDFDVMISDLAPVDLLIQRAGRLWRHPERDRSYCAARGPVLHVISADPATMKGDQWLDGVLPEAGWIYQNPELLWRSADAIFGARAIVTRTLTGDDDCPGHPRRLVERVYGDLQPPVEEGTFGTEAAGRELTHRQVAKAAVLDPRKPYTSDGGPWVEDAWVRTRLGDSITVRLARQEGGKLVPLVADRTDDWTLSEVRISPRMAKGLSEPTSEQRRQLAPRWRDADTARLLVLERRGDEYANVETGHHYRAITGLTRSTE